MKSILLVLAILGAGFYFYGLNFMLVLLAISFLIFFHELGHFLAAKKLGICVNVFSVGFGEKIYTKKIGQTEYAISAIPLGGYVSLKGQEDLNPNARSDDKDSYTTLHPLGRIFILLAGPAFNIILAFFIYIALGYIGVERLAPKVGKIGENSAAAAAGIQLNDEILFINQNKINEWDDISKFVTLEPLNLQLKRNGEIINLTLTPKIGEKKNMWLETIKTPLIGISPNDESVILKNTGLNSLKFALDETYKASTLILVGLQKLITGVVPAREMGGIVAITDITAKAVAFGPSVFLFIVALISVNLGILNLLPIPALDGGHIAFNIYELIFRRPVSKRVFVALSYVGMALLFALMAFTIINDFLRLGGAYN
ncbi:MAG: RIP metalloprotease RseP [Campylobacter sp.]|nr:RIP metalloprotease RseP [Campylobacter sp.]MBR0071513.1 RIP metalloprotease RseP [Campylobacter sp.]